ncbi:hypothetical protein Hypma_002279 [Hypsizygus marmoreus]|uniref:Uncharacterized protein n=1 Tax=Hypsizygus marmoreus TaxID=39966 RepID=A0A369JZV4_HYPMA|nr:hypothetical protein Hypma_002279 [Hypsizygus marmoreus]
MASTPRRRHAVPYSWAVDNSNYDIHHSSQQNDNRCSSPWPIFILMELHVTPRGQHAFEFKPNQPSPYHKKPSPNTIIENTKHNTQYPRTVQTTQELTLNAHTTDRRHTPRPFGIGGYNQPPDHRSVPNVNLQQACSKSAYGMLERPISKPG